MRVGVYRTGGGGAVGAGDILIHGPYSQVVLRDSHSHAGGWLVRV